MEPIGARSIPRSLSSGVGVHAVLDEEVMKEMEGMEVGGLVGGDGDGDGMMVLVAFRLLALLLAVGVFPSL